MKMKATGTSIVKGDLISFDMTSDNFIEGVLSTSDGTNKLTVATGAIDQFGKDYMVLFALNTAADGWDNSVTVPSKDVANVVGNVATGAKATVSVKGTTTTINLAGEVTKGVPAALNNVFTGKEGNDTDLTAVTLKGIIPESGSVTITQKNDALKVYYSTSFSDGEKIGTYDRVNSNGGETNGDYSLLIQEGKTATVTVSDDTGVIATYVVTTTGLTVKE